LKVYPFPRDKQVFRESLSCIFNIVDDGDARELVLPWRCRCSKRVLKRERKERKF